MGTNCSYLTGMMAQRVLEEGQVSQFEGLLHPTPNDLESQVAAPFTVGPEQHYVVANEVLDHLMRQGATQEVLSLEGKVLEVGDVSYFVVTSWTLE